MNQWIEKNKGKIEKITAAVLVFLILFWGIPGMNKGIDVQDTSSYLIKYRYFFKQGVGGNSLYYFLGEFLGSLIYHVFPRLLALNIAGYLIYLLTGFMTWKLFSDKLPRVLLLLAVFAGCTFGVSWVRCLNWNAWSMLFLSIGLWMIFQGFRKEKNAWYFLAGLVLGLNAFVRMPNIFFLVLVLVIGFYHWDTSKKQAVQGMLFMTGGGALAGILGVGFSVLILGFSKFQADFFWLLNSGGDTQSRHNFFSMFGNVIYGGMDGIRQWVKYGVFLGMLMLLTAGIKKKWKKDFSVLAYGIAAVAAAVIGYTRQVAVSSDPSLLSVQNFLAYGAVAWGIFGMFYFYKKDKQFSALCLSVVLILLAMTLGTDTGSIFFRVYLGVPAAMTAAILWKLPWRSLRQAGVFVVVLAAVTGLNCGRNYVYHDGAMETLTAEVDSPVFQGMKTTPERAEYVNRLIGLLEPYEELELLTIGAFNIGCNVTDMKPFFDSAWADLDYLTMEEFTQVLQEKIEAGQLPVIVIGTEKINGDYWVPEKIEYLETLTKTELFETKYQDEWYAVYVPAQETGGNTCTK